MPVLSKQAVLSGAVDYCCLLCEVTFKDYDEAVKHVGTKEHTDNFAASSYTEKYAAEHIRKVKQLFYCEACNVVISSSRKIQQHVTDEEHEFNNTNDEEPMRTTLFRRHGDQVIAFDDILIEEEAWNGIVDESCVLCDVDWDDLKSHISELKHVVNLINMKVQSGINNTLFRKIDNSQFQCLTCNAVLPQDQFVIHWDGKDHQKLHIKCRKAKRSLEDSKKEAKDEKHESGKPDTPKKGGTTDLNSTNTSTNKESGVKKSQDMKKEKPMLFAHYLNPINIESTINDENAKAPDSPVKKKPVKENISNFTYKDLNEELDLKSYMMKGDNGLHLCVLCNWEFEPDLYKAHLNKEHHKIIEAMHKDEIKKLNKRVLSKSKGENEVLNGESKDRDMIQHMLGDLKNDGIEINFLSDTASCKKCKKSLDLKLEAIVPHIDSHKIEEVRKKTNNQSTVTGENEDNEHVNKLAVSTVTIEPLKLNAEDELKEFYKQNHIIVKDKTATCQVCNAEMAFVKKCLNEHINGARHKRNAARNEAENDSDDYTDCSSDESEDSYEATEKLPMDKFVVLFKQANDDCIVNNNLCVSVNSYTLTRSHECLCCDQNMSKAEVERHVNSPAHRKKMAAIPVITSLKNELVRQIKANAFHCGICHFVIVGWSNLQRHLKYDDEHLREKIFSNMRLMMRQDSVNEDTLKFIRKVNESSGRTYFS